MNFPDFDHLAPERDKQFLSMGFLMQLVQITPGQLRVLMEETGVQFSEVRDGIGYVTHNDAIKVLEKCRDVRQEIHDVATSHERN